MAQTSDNVKLVTGTFTGTGRSDWFRVPPGVSKINYILDHSGTATVTLDASWDSGTTWHILVTATTDANGSVDANSNLIYSFNCSAHTNNVDYFLAAQETLSTIR